MSKSLIQETLPDTHQDAYSKTVFGFWIYLLTDFILFGTLFATYVVLRNNTFGGPSGKELFNLHAVLDRTLVLMISSFTAGLAGVMAHRHKKRMAVSCFAVTCLLGFLFLILQWEEFHYLLLNGYRWEKSAFLSAYFTLLGTFWIHVAFACLWSFVLVIPVCFQGLNRVTVRRLTCLRMFWQFLTIIWVFIFTVIYLLRG